MPAADAALSKDALKNLLAQSNRKWRAHANETVDVQQTSVDFVSLKLLDFLSWVRSAKMPVGRRDVD